MHFHFTGVHEYTSHDSRRVFASYIVSQRSLRLAECAAFAANHSRAIQVSHYVSEDVKRSASQEAILYYQSQTADSNLDADYLPDSDDESESLVLENADYDRFMETGLKHLDELAWDEACDFEKQKDESEKVILSHLVTTNVRVNLLSLIVGLGQNPQFLEATGGKDVLEFFLGPKAMCHNMDGCGLLLDMLDFDPEREDSRVLLKHLYLVCSMWDSQTTVLEAERNWLYRLTRSVYNLSKPNTVAKLSLRLKRILLKLNVEKGFRYVAGNDKIESILRQISLKTVDNEPNSPGAGVKRTKPERKKGKRMRKSN